MSKRIIGGVKIEGEDKSLSAMHELHKYAHPNPMGWSLRELEDVGAVYKDGDVYRITKSGEDIIKRRLERREHMGESNFA